MTRSRTSLSSLDRETVREAISEYIKVFYDRIRRHSTTGNISQRKFGEINQAEPAHGMIDCDPSSQTPLRRNASRPLGRWCGDLRGTYFAGWRSTGPLMFERVIRPMPADTMQDLTVEFA